MKTTILPFLAEKKTKIKSCQQISCHISTGLSNFMFIYIGQNFCHT